MSTRTGSRNGSSDDGTPWLTPTEQRAWRAWLAVSNVLPPAIERDLQRDSQLSGADFRVLSTLSERPGHRCALKDLAAEMLWSRSRLSHHLDRMAARDLVARESDATDARGCIVVLTDHGWQTTQAAAPPHVRSVRDRLVDLLDADELITLIRICDKVVEAIVAVDGPASVGRPPQENRPARR